GSFRAMSVGSPAAASSFGTVGFTFGRRSAMAPPTRSPLTTKMPIATGSIGHSPGPQGTQRPGVILRPDAAEANGYTAARYPAASHPGSAACQRPNTHVSPNVLASTMCSDRTFRTAG